MIKSSSPLRAVLKTGVDYVKSVAWCLAQGRGSVNGSWFCCCLFFVDVVFQQEAEVITVGQPASGRKANSDSIHESSKERHSTKAGGRRQWTKGSGVQLSKPSPAASFPFHE